MSVRGEGAMQQNSEGKTGSRRRRRRKRRNRNAYPSLANGEMLPPLLTASSGRATAEADDSDPLLAYIQHDADYLSTSAKAARDGVNRLLKSMGPTCEAEAKRRKIAVYVAGLLNEAGFSCHLNGSYALKTYLPDSDIDLGVLTEEWDTDRRRDSIADCNSRENGRDYTREEVDADGTESKRTTVRSRQWFLRVNEALCRASTSSSASSLSSPSAAYTKATVRNVSFVNAQVKLVTCTVNNTHVDVCMLSRSSLAAVAFFEAFDRLIGQDHLFKRSVVLLKGWALYDAGNFHRDGVGEPILGARRGLFSSYAVTTLLAAVFVRHLEMEPSGTLRCSISHPLDALIAFFTAYSDFDFSAQCMTICGPFALERHDAGKHHVSSAKRIKKSSIGVTDFQRKLVTALRRRALLGTLSESEEKGGDGLTAKEISEDNVHSPSSTFQKRACNVLDPLDNGNNIARSVSTEALKGVREVCRRGREVLIDVLRNGARIEAMFPVSWKTFAEGGGWRPDLLHHPREIWSSRLFFPVPAEVLRQDIYAVDQEQLQGAVGAVASIGHRKAIKSQEEQATKSEQTDSSLRVLETRGEDAKEEEKQEAQRREAEVMQETIDIIECPVDETESIATASPDTSLSFDGIEPLESSCSSDSEDPPSEHESRIDRDEARIITSDQGAENPPAQTSETGEMRVENENKPDVLERTSTGSVADLRKNSPMDVVSSVPVSNNESKLQQLLDSEHEDPPSNDVKAKAVMGEVETNKHTKTKEAVKDEDEEELKKKEEKAWPGMKILLGLSIISLWILYLLQERAAAPSFSGVSVTKTPETWKESYREQQIRMSTAPRSRSRKEDTPSMPIPAKSLETDADDLHLPAKIDTATLDAKECTVEIAWKTIVREMNTTAGPISTLQIVETADTADEFNVEGRNRIVIAVTEPEAAALSEDVVGEAPVVVSQASSQWAKVGSQIIFGANVIYGDEELNFQWRHNGVDIDGATDALLIMQSIERKDAGTYTCAVRNSFGTSVWEESVLHIGSPPVTKKKLQEIRAASGERVTFDVGNVEASPQPSYQWRQNGVDIAGANSRTFVVESTSAKDSGTYTCVVSNLAGSATWEEVVLTVT
eukprot:g1016.t1